MGREKGLRNGERERVKEGSLHGEIERVKEGSLHGEKERVKGRQPEKEEGLRKEGRRKKTGEDKAR